jgi:UDP-N-acetylmuramyl pentapeptide phosphotransferase/UDP-N-acetylglucosamine-1-phosphate transferase
LTGTGAARDLGYRLRLLDRPNQRSSHSAPTPRLGGVAIVAGTVAGEAVLSIALGPNAAVLRMIAAGTALALLIGLVDDVRGLSPATKVCGELCASVAVAALWVPAFAPIPAVVAVAGASFWLLSYTNQFNFMDGSDGLAAGMAALNAASLSVLAFSAGRPDLAWSALVIGAAAAGFLWHNVAPASVFMGDTGSLFLGFTVASLVLFVESAGVPPIIAAAPLAPFIMDTTVTLCARAIRRELLWRAHRSHLYQRLLIAGWTKSAVAWLYYSWGASSGLAAYVAVRASANWLTAAAALAAVQGVGLFGVVALVLRAERRQPLEQPAL